MDIEIIDCLVEAKKQNDNLLTILNSNCNNQYFISLQSKMKEITVDIAKDFGEYLYNIMFPISYKTFSGNSQSNYRKVIGVGKWFGNIVHTNISYWSKDDTFDNLTEEYIQFLPKKKQFIVRDFLTFSKELKLHAEQNKTFTHDIHNSINAYKVGQIICRSNNPTPMYIHLIHKVPNIIINGINISHSVNKPFSIDIQLLYTGSEITSLNDIYSIKSDGLSSNILKRISHSEFGFFTCLDNPETFLTDQVKTTLETLVSSGLNFQKKWNDLKMKYAYLLLHKGKI